MACRSILNASALLTLLLVTACGGGGGEATPAATTTTPPIAQTPVTEAATAGARLQASAAGYALDTPDVPVSAYQQTRWKAFLVAGNTQEPVFDNFVLSFSKWLGQRGVSSIEILQAKSPNVTLRSSSENILSALVRGAPGPNEGCLVYMTSHGSGDSPQAKGGLWLAPAGGREETLTPVALNEMLGNSCGTRPTVVVLSGCYTGVYMNDAIAAPNRIVLTAARADRTSFGCEATGDYTFFDKCVLQNLDTAGTVQKLTEKVRACVGKREADEKFTPSEPQAFFGRDMRDLALPALPAATASELAALDSQP
ncbi:C13 family peptidase [Niveibacterium sp. 24ML]|uniref:C13 family peptidase n=1 Tax=Niveibacterium sp. 24ML TaxID=2985512 RepID=UPI0022712D08|nr:C13 family peptidase [Niveibacterium sp. 24ML]MCX9155697.1 C13 family peptidase [Niveibacterium sp. 24ML]